jgi:hypothetical protein
MVGEFSANASYLGYLHQSRYALFLLLTSKTNDPAISIEKYDDVSIEENGIVQELTQIKLHIKSTKSLSDASEDLWKTLRIWSTAIREKQVDLDEIKFTIITTCIASKGSIASMLKPNGLGDKRNESEALTKLRSIATHSDSRSNAEGRKSFLKLSDDEQEQLVRKIIVLDSSPDIIDIADQIKKEIRIFCRPQFVDSFFQRLEGWWMGKIIHVLITNGESSPIIYQSELNSFIQDLVEQFHLDNLPIDFADPLDLDEDDIPESKKIFIKQLELVTFEKPRIKHAISDYYRAFQQRSKWVREDLLLTDELISYEKRLLDEWSRLFDDMKEDISPDALEDEKIKKGRDLFRLIDSKSGINIRPRCTDPYIMRGSYHLLADELRIGWHVDFVSRLEDLLTNYTEQ